MVERTLPLLFICLAFQCGSPAKGAAWVAGVEGNPGSYLLTHHDEPRATLEFHHTPKRDVEPPSEVGWLEGIAAPGGAYSRATWPFAAPDRFDRFSIRWRGVWEPGEGRYWIRLRSDGEAKLFIGGEETVSTSGAASGATREMNLEQRPYDLRLDYSHSSGTSHVFLECRSGEGSWLPLVPSHESKGGVANRWEGTYFLGPNFETQMFQRLDEKILWNWGSLGPFNRPEDLPSLSLEWSREEERLYGSILANRDGNLEIVLQPVNHPHGATVEFERTLLNFRFGNEPPIQIQFDQSGVFRIADDRPVLTFEMQSERPLRFWETGGSVKTGDRVGRELDRKRRSYESTRPRLEGDISHLDHPVIEFGRWWITLYLIRQEARSEGTLPRGWEEDLSDWARMFAPDLIGRIESATGGPTSQTISFSESPPSQSNNEDRFYPERQVDWEVLTLPEGLYRWHEGFLDLRERLGLKVGQSVPLDTRNIDGDVAMRNLPELDPEISFLYSGTHFRIETREGCFLEFGGPVVVESFSINERGEWEAAIENPKRSRLEVGPDSMVHGIMWNEEPILLTGEGASGKRGFLPAERGVLRLIPKLEANADPRF